MKKKLLIALIAITAAVCGAFGFSACGNDGINGTNGTNGENGRDGLSTYQIWLNNGHTGSETDFLEWLQGANGIDGDDGATVKEADFDEDGNLILIMSDGKKINCGKIPVETDVENLSYMAVKKDGEIVGYNVTGIGNISDLDVVIPATYKNKPVISIVQKAFENNILIESVAIPDSVKSIGEKAFNGCTALESISVDENNTVFTSLDEILYKKENAEIVLVPKAIKGNITLLDGVSTIDSQIFKNCKSLESITFSDSVTSIGSWAFDGCTSLAELKFKDMVSYCQIDGLSYVSQSEVYIGEQKLTEMKSITIPEGVTSIDDAAFKDCSSLTGITVEQNNKNFKSIDGNLYSIDGTTLIKYSVAKTQTAFTVPDGVNTINWGAFKNCTSLTDLIIPDSVTSVKSEAFFGCNSLKIISVPAVAMNSIPKKNLEEVTITSGTSIDPGVFTSAFNGASKLINLTIADSLTSIHNDALQTCTSLKKATLPAIAASALHNTNVEEVIITSGRSLSGLLGCSKLTSITLPDTLKTIDRDAFSSCSSLKSITIPEGVTSFGMYAFYKCSSLTDITFKGNQAQWTAIEKRDYWNNNTGNYTIHCTDGDISK